MILAGEYFEKHGCCYLGDQCCTVYFTDDKDVDFNVLTKSYSDLMEMPKEQVMALREKAEVEGNVYDLYVIDYLVEHLDFFNWDKPEGREP